MKFKGKVSQWWYVAAVFFNAIFAALFLTNNSTDSSLMFIPMLILIDLYMIPVMFRYYITVDKDNVIVYFGLLRKTIPTKKITAIKAMKSYKASFATSFDRIGIQPTGMDVVFVSVEDKQGFLKELLKVNRKIKYLIQ